MQILCKSSIGGGTYLLVKRESGALIWTFAPRYRHINCPIVYLPPHTWTGNSNNHDYVFDEKLYKEGLDTFDGYTNSF